MGIKKALVPLRSTDTNLLSFVWNGAINLSAGLQNHCVLGIPYILFLMSLSEPLSFFFQISCYKYLFTYVKRFSTVEENVLGASEHR